MNELIQELHDIEMIKQLKHRYFRAIDMADHGLLDSVFTDDVKVDYRGGTYVWEASGKKEIIQSLKYSFHSETAAMHTGHHPEISIHDDVNASGIWYLQDIFYNFNENALTQGTALYKDKYVKTEEGWRINFSEYDRIIESVTPIDKDQKFTLNHLAKHGMKLDK